LDQSVRPTECSGSERRNEGAAELIERRGQLDERKKIAADDLMTIYGGDDAEEAGSVSEVLRRELATIKPGDYIAFLNYIEETPEVIECSRSFECNCARRLTAL
jgi:hypothetical protein